MVSDGRPVITPRSPSAEVLPSPNPRRTHGRTGRAAVTAGTLSPVGDDVAGEDVKRYVKGRDADRDDANVMHGNQVQRTWEQRLKEVPRPGPHFRSATQDALDLEAEAIRQGRLRRWQAIR